MRGPWFFSRWYLPGLDCPPWFFHSLIRLTLSWCCLFTRGLLGLSTSACLCPLHLAWTSHAWWLGSEIKYSKRENSKRHTQKLQGLFWASLRSPRKSHSVGYASHWSQPLLKERREIDSTPERQERKQLMVATSETSYHRPPSDPNKSLPHAKYTHPLLRPSKVSSQYGISLMSRISISKSGPGVVEASQMQFLRYSYWSIVPLDLN